MDDDLVVKADVIETSISNHFRSNSNAGNYKERSRSRSMSIQPSKTVKLPENLDRIADLESHNEHLIHKNKA